MLEFPRWKHILIALVLVASAIYALPNIYPQDPSLQIVDGSTAGLDEAATKVRRDETIAKVRKLLDEAKIPVKSMAYEGDSLIVRLTDPELQVRAADYVRPRMGEQGYTVALNLASTVPGWLSAVGAQPMTLGLDLRGGVHFLLQVDQVAAREKRENAYVDEVRKLLRDKDINYTSVGRDANGILVTLAKAADRIRAVNLLADNVPALAVVDENIADSLRLQLPAATVQQIADEAIEQNMTGLRNRVAALAEPVIQRQGNSRIAVALPGVQDTVEAKRLMGETATLEWRAVVDTTPGSTIVPPDARLYRQRERGADGLGLPILLSKRVIVSGEQIVDARPGIDPETSRPMVSIQLDSAGGKRMLDHTLDHVGKRMAIVYITRTPVTAMVDGKEVRTSRTTEEVISDATIQGVFGSQFQTTGLEREEAQRLSEDIKAGALAAPMDIVEERVIGPSLGAENVRRGIQAVLYSFVFVMVFFVVYYRMFGIITNLALLMNLLLVVAVMSLPGVGATLSLPGFAGIALTVGMSVDANVLINERIREELRLGLTPLAAIAAGYDKASGTIADANVTALLGGIAMAAFGSGPIKGFGITLIIGIITSMFTAVMVSRGIATLIYGGRRKLSSISI
jgi:preprotein translocase subunit SecD